MSALTTSPDDESTDNINKVQLDIHLGHSKTFENTIAMLKDGSPLTGITVCDAGYGTGSLSTPLAKEGAIVSASDISSVMVADAKSKTEMELEGSATMPKFEVRDLESIEERYHTVVCLDVLIHYPQEKAVGMIGHLASLVERRQVLSFAPKTWYFDMLKRVGELFLGPSKATRAYLHAPSDVERALEWVGRRVSKQGFINVDRGQFDRDQFYFANLIEAVPINVGLG